jgi:hypothetical protein
LEFLASKLVEHNIDPDRAIDEIEERALQLRIYAKDCENVETLEYSEEELELENSNSIKPDHANSPLPTQFPASPQQPSLPPIPDIPGIKPDVLSNLLMSWFYVGYYTGLAEGQKSRDSS